MQSYRDEAFSDDQGVTVETQCLKTSKEEKTRRRRSITVLTVGVLEDVLRCPWV